MQSPTYDYSPIEKRISTLSLQHNPKQQSPTEPDYINRYSQKYDSYQAFLYSRTENHQNGRRRLSSTGDGSGDSSSTTASGSSCGERDEGSEGRTESDEMDRVDDRVDERKPPEGQVTEAERLQVEAFFKGFKTQVC